MGIQLSMSKNKQSKDYLDALFQHMYLSNPSLVDFFCKISLH